MGALARLAPKERQRKVRLALLILSPAIAAAWSVRLYPKTFLGGAASE